MFLNVWLPAEFLLWWNKSNQDGKQVVSQLPCSRSLSVCVSCLVCCSCHMPSRTTRRCKETLQQVRERLTREQANKTNKRIHELLGNIDSDSESDSEDEQDSNFDERVDSLSLLRRDLYLGLLCLLLLIILLSYWIRSNSLGNWVLVFQSLEEQFTLASYMYRYIVSNRF